MASVTATINVQINAANAAAQLTALQGKVAAMNKGMLAATAGGVMAQEKAIRRMGNVLSGSGMFTTGIRNVHTELGRMHQEFDRGSTTLQKYRQNSRMWGRDHSAINRMAADRVRMLQSQYVALGKEMNGVQKSMQIKPDRMMREFGADAMYAHQRAMLFRRNLQMGSTALVNWGKNTQWAGRQMMVGMGIPIAIAAAGAVKAFNDIEKASISFKRVYGDATTSVAEKSQMLSKMQATVGKEMMKYGVAMSDTLEVSAQAAATGAKGADLIAATRETMRLATLGNMDYNKALGATIAMQTAFNINAKDMASTTDFLNAVENQTILTMEDMASAVPRVAPVIKGLGGNVQDLAIMMTALRQGGVTAEQGANALKSGLGSLLNPTGTAIDQFDALGINLQKVVDTNKGDLIGTIKSLGKELDGLGKYDRQRALESLFGKYQYSRMGALLKNINSKAAKETMRLAKANTSELAKMSQQELDQISSSPMIKLRASIEELKAAAAPLGALFSDVAAKIVSFATPIVKFFANNDIAKWGLVATAGFAALAGVVTMIVGVFANFTGSMIKAGMVVKSFFRLITGQRSLAYVTTDELEASAAANSLATAAERAAGGMMAEAKAAQLLTSQLEALIAAQNGAAATSRRPGPGTTGTPVAPKPSGPGGTPIPTTVVPPTATRQVDIAHLQASHIGGSRPLTPAEVAAIKKMKLPAAARRTVDSLQPGQQLFGRDNRTFFMSKKENDATANVAGMKASEYANILRSRPYGVTTANLMSVLGRNMGMTTADAAVWANSPEGQRVSRAIVDASIAEMDRLGDTRVQDVGAGKGNQSIQKIINDAVDKELGRVDPAAQAAWRQAGKIGTIKVADGRDYTVGAENQGASYKGEKNAGSTNEAMVRKFGQDSAFPPSTPAQERKAQSDSARAASTRSKAAKATEAADQAKVKAAQSQTILAATEEKNSKADIAARKAAALESRAARLNGTQAESGIATMERKAAARIKANAASAGLQKTSTSVGSTYAGLLSGWDTKENTSKPSFRDRYRSNKESSMLSGRMPGMGLMGVGMLASTAIMGLEMSGKEIPNAVNFAVNGLTGIGMASMFFPGAMTKVSSGLKAMSSGVTGLVPMLGATGPIGMAVAGIAAVSAGLLLYGKSQVDHLKDQTIKLAKTYSATSEVVEAYADEVGKESRSHKEARIAASLATKETISLSESQKAEAKLASESGQVMLQNVKDAFAGGGIQSAITSITGQIGTLMSEGLIGRKGAKNLAVTMGQAIGLNEQQQVQLLGVLDKITGPGIDNPLEVKVKVQKQGFEQSIRDAMNGYEQKGWWGKFASSLASSSPTEDAAGAAMAQQAMQTNISGSGYNQLIAAMRDSGLKTGQAIAAYSREIDKNFKGASMGYNKQDVSSLQSFADGVGVNAPARMGAIRIKAMIAQGDISPEAFDKLFEGTDKDIQRNMLINVGGMNTKSEEMLSAIMTKGGGEADSLRNWLSTEGVDASQVNAMGNAYEKLGSAASRFSIDFTKTTPKMLESMKPVAKQIENMPISMQKAIQIDPSTINAPKAYAKNLQYVKTAAQVANTSLKGLGLDKKTLNDPKELNKAIKGMKGSKVDLKVRAKLDQKDLKPKGKVEVATKWKQPDGKIKPPSGKVGVSTKWKQPDGKIKKPDKQTVPVKYGQPQNAIKKPEVAVQKVNREVGVENLPDPNESKQIINRHLGLRPELVAPSPVSQTVNRKVVGATGGMFANGGIHKGDGKVRGEGGPTDDKVNARLSNGEFVIRASSVRKYGEAFISSINRGVYDKNGFKNGTKSPIKAGSLDKDGRKDYKSLINEAKGVIKEFGAFGKILKQGKLLLNKSMRSLGKEFTTYIIDNYDPKQIKKMFKGKKDAGAKVIAKRFQAEQRQELLSQIRSGRFDSRAVKFGMDNAGYGAAASVAGQMSGEDMKFASTQPKLFQKLFKQRVATERATQIRDFKQQVEGTDANVLAQLGGDSKLYKAAQQLGMNMTDVATAMANGFTSQQIKDLGASAEIAAAALMEYSERQGEMADNFSKMADAVRSNAEAKARVRFNNAPGGTNGGIGMSETRANALIALKSAQNDIDQAKIDDINEKYSKQLETFDQIAQVQQAIANLERGRLSVANALSTGDIAAAAAAAQEQRANTASFMQDQMRNQLENQQKAQTAVLQDAINARMRESRDLQNQMNLIIAETINENVTSIEKYQASADAILSSNLYLEDQIRLLSERNAVLAAAATAPPATTVTPPPNSNQAGSAAPSAAEVGWSLAKIALDKLSNKDKKFLEKNTFKTGQGGGAWKAVWMGWSQEKRNKVLNAINDGVITSKEEKKITFARGGVVPGMGNRDTISAMLTPGEFVMNKASSARFGPMLHAMNTGALKNGGGVGGVQIDNIIFNINGANLNERDIAEIAVRKMKSLDSATIRGGRF